MTGCARMPTVAGAEGRKTSTRSDARPAPCEIGKVAEAPRSDDE